MAVIHIYFIVAVLSYLLGSIPFGYILVRIFRGQDIRHTGSGNIGATNVIRSGARWLGLVTLLLDAAKGYAAVALSLWIAWQLTPHAAVLTTPEQMQTDPALQQLLARSAHFPFLIAAVAAIFAILGHMFPVWLHFKGGKGVATGLGTFLAIAPKAVGVVVVIFLAVVFVSRYVSLGSIIATASFPLFAWLLYRGSATPAVMTGMFVAAALIIARHHQNIRRLLAGTEHRFELKHR